MWSLKKATETDLGPSAGTRQSSPGTHYFPGFFNFFVGLCFTRSSAGWNEMILIYGSLSDVSGFF